MSNKNDNRLTKAERKNITKSRKFAKSLSKDGDAYAFLAEKAYRQVKAGR